MFSGVHEQRKISHHRAPMLLMNIENAGRISDEVSPKRDFDFEVGPGLSAEFENGLLQMPNGHPYFVIHLIRLIFRLAAACTCQGVKGVNFAHAAP